MPKATKPVPRDIPKEPAQTKERRAVVEESWPLPAVVVAHHITYDGHPDSYPLHITSKILSGRQSSRISLELSTRSGSRSRRSAAATSSRIRTCSYAVAIVQPGQTPEAAEQALIAEFDKLTNEPVTANELQRAKNQFARDYIVSRESNRTRRGTSRTPR